MIKYRNYYQFWSVKIIIFMNAFCSIALYPDLRGPFIWVLFIEKIKQQIELI